MDRREFISTVTVAGLVSAGTLLPHPVRAVFADPIPRGGTPMPYTLPDLPYAYDALAPYLTAQTLQFHHDKHHAAYVKGLNDAVEKLDAAQKAGDFAAIRALCDAVAFNYSGHVLHSIYWTGMKPGGGGAPSGELAAQIEKNFGSVDTFKAEFLAAANAVQGSGWAVLAWEPVGGRLFVLQAEKHQNLAAWGATPIMVLDVWEHAYYLQYQNMRADFTKGFFSVVNWDDAARRLQAVLK
jgi:Fe-Mn family superoxide dismutase